MLRAVLGSLIPAINRWANLAASLRDDDRAMVATVSERRMGTTLCCGVQVIQPMKEVVPTESQPNPDPQAGISDLRRPFRRTDVTMHELDGEALVYDPISADTHRLNQTAFFIWRHCDGESDVKQIAQRLAETYEVPIAAATEHVNFTLEQLQGRGLIVEGSDVGSDSD